jgi:C4-dicarboxylate transporter DctM subunit
MSERFSTLPRVLPFVVLLTGVMVALYGGDQGERQDAAEAGGLGRGGVAAVERDHDAGEQHHDAHHRHVAALRLRDELPPHLAGRRRRDRGARPVAVTTPNHTRSNPAALSGGRMIGAVIRMIETGGRKKPPLKAAGFDLVWFGVVMTITMEMGLIHPPVGLNSHRAIPGTRHRITTATAIRITKGSVPQMISESGS